MIAPSYQKLPDGTTPKRTQLKHLLLDVTFFSKTKVRTFRRVHGDSALLFYLDTLASLSATHSGLLTYEDVFTIGMDYLKPEKVKAVIEYLISQAMLQTNEQNLISNRRVSEDQEKCAERQEKWREKKRRQREDVPGDSMGDKEGTDTETLNVQKSEVLNIEDLDRSKKKEKPEKLRFGEAVFLTHEEADRLQAELGPEKFKGVWQFFNDYIQEKSYRSKNHNLAIRRWVIRAYEERELKDQELARRVARVTSTPTSGRRITNAEQNLLNLGADPAILFKENT